ncbi:MAG: hypothetical protein R3Y12_01490 [Clostridia bacterium]
MKNNVTLENNIINIEVVPYGLMFCSEISVFNSQSVVCTAKYSVNVVKVRKNSVDKILCLNVVFIDELDKNMQKKYVQIFNDGGKVKVSAVKLCKNIAK